MKPSEPSQVASDRIADFLAERILSGELKPGERIKQDELASQLNTSRIPVRDALRILETRGLVSLQANIGARVASLTLHDMELSYRIRESLEPMLLAESIPHLTEQDFADLRAANAALKAVSSIEDYMPLSRTFHWTAFRGHRAPMLAQIVERLWDTTQVYRRTYAQMTFRDAERMQVMCDERDLLLGSILRREVDLAPRILATHIRRTQTSLRQYRETLGSAE